MPKKGKRVLLVLAVAWWCGLFEIYALNDIQLKESTKLKLDLILRTNCINDQRIYWSGLEFSFGVEAMIGAVVEKKFNWGSLSLENEFLLNQPFGDNILKDEERSQYLANFSVDSLAISKLNLQIRVGDLKIKIGKAETPFGRTFFPVFSNNFNFGSPFIRSEAILWRETGIFIRYKLGILMFDLAAVNGGENRDTNSGKGGVFRLGLEGKKWGVGISHKVHDGVGSEWQKVYKGHSGVDFRLEFSPLIFSGELIYDRYGFHRAFDENDIFWPTSIYYRDVFYQSKTPISGVGGYINLMYRSAKWILNLNYGEYYPQEIGNIYHDTPNKRGIVKLAYNFGEEFWMFLVGILENQRPREPWRSGAKPFAGMLSFEYRL